MLMAGKVNVVESCLLVGIVEAMNVYCIMTVRMMKRRIARRFFGAVQ